MERKEIRTKFSTFIQGWMLAVLYLQHTALAATMTAVTHRAQLHHTSICKMLQSVTQHH